MDCTEFLTRHSDLADGVPAGDRARFEEHLTRCPSCARYDRVVRQGIQLCRELPRIEPSGDFLPRLQHKIYHLEDELARRPAFTGSTVLAVVLILGFVTAAWLPALLHRHEVVLPPIVVEAPARPHVAPPFAYTPLWFGVEGPSIFWTARREAPSSWLTRSGISERAAAPSLWSADRLGWGSGALVSLSDDVR